MKYPFALALMVMASLCWAAEPNLVVNGSFELAGKPDTVPDGWAVSGSREVKQQLMFDTGRDGRRCAKLECTAFGGEGPASHAMIAQAGRVAVRHGQWYRFSFWAKGGGIKGSFVDVALTNTRRWENAGLAEAFTASAKWQRFEFLFQAKDNLPAATSRLQFWFKGTGTLWLDEVSLVESATGLEWFPQIATDGVKNFVPNSSFECDGANWGSYTYGLSGWAGNLYRLEGAVDGAVASHGGYSLKIALSPKTLPVFWFDYYEPIRQPVRRVLAANRGWFRVTPGEKMTLSAFMRADSDGVVAQLAAIEAPSRMLRQAVTVGREWKRFEFTFAPRQPFIFIAAGLDLDESKLDAATIWLDAIQLERGDRATDYAPRASVESFIETAAPGNTFIAPADGATLTVRACNDSDREQTVRGKLMVTDFFDKTVFENHPAITVSAHSSGSVAVRGICKGRQGFFRTTWTAGAEPQALRMAIIEPAPKDAKDSPMGFNHAYPWQFLVKLARQAGIVWWRDWSAKWQTCEPEKGRFDWSVADAQIKRVLELDSEVDVMIPFPSALWNSTSDPEKVAKEAGRNSYLKTRLPVAFAPKDFDDFGRFAADVVKYYRVAKPRAVTTYQLLNESVYTSYSLSQRFGYTVDDYVRLAGIAYRAMKAADPNCRVVAGCGANPVGAATREFIEKGGLQFADIFDVHMYDPTVPAESYEETFSKLEDLMRAHGGPKPVWLTEWGCYADDDPPSVPWLAGDAAMNRCRWPNERAATEHIVKFTAVTFAHGMRKIFFHAGTCGPINGSDAGGVLFEYGGAPRKMLSGVAALTHLLGVPDECVKKIVHDDLRAYVFRSKGRAVAIAWCGENQRRPLTLAKGVRAYDIMGNALPPREAALGELPVYLAGGDAESVLQSLPR
ncbi:MAG: carbohydrate binding domain-containing protein [Verrucomicrobia bacterium]|nr:carbohydrate binding domain-containing protein [Verrucomicrobiota bacterium]